MLPVATPNALRASTEGHMKRAFFNSLSAIIALSAVYIGSPKACAYDGWYPRCYCFGRMDEHFDGSTLCAWRRTWHGPNSLSTPLRGYYLPRPAKCCGCYGPGETSGYASCDQCYRPSCMNCECADQATGTVYPADVMAALGPAKFARLGKVSNELDVLGPAGSPARAS